MSGSWNWTTLPTKAMNGGLEILGSRNGRGAFWRFRVLAGGYNVENADEDQERSRPSLRDRVHCPVRHTGCSQESGTSNLLCAILFLTEDDSGWLSIYSASYGVIERVQGSAGTYFIVIEQRTIANMSLCEECMGLGLSDRSSLLKGS